MTAIYKLRWQLWAFCLLVCLSPHAVAASELQQPQYRVIGAVFTGLKKTSSEWLASYLDLHYPVNLNATDLHDLERKLMTTAVFTSVAVTTRPIKGTENDVELQVAVEERWTLIPVVRGAYGGGIPLRVLGFYDVHLLGQLLTGGAETRQYGSAPPGFLFYGRNPRAAADRNYYGAEFWREFRRRQVFDRSGVQIGELSTDTGMARIRALLAVDDDSGASLHKWRIGGDLEAVQENPSRFINLPTEPRFSQPQDLFVRSSKRQLVKVLPTLLYNDILVDQLHYDGLRFRLRLGPVISSDKTASAGEFEGFYYAMLGANWNFASRAVIGANTINSLQSQYFLGGLDTVRGLPDSALYGNSAAFANLELRHLEFKAKYLWFQTASFLDIGEAGSSWEDAGTKVRLAAGFGFRAAVPQVYRLMFRLDYAWSLVGAKTHGVTIGLNQFFDSVTPL
jgi:hypothetical protein